MTEKLSLLARLLKVQRELKAPKNQYNDFGEYSYRNCEDILEAVKPLLEKHDLVLALSDDIVSVGDRNYVQATAILQDYDSDGAVIRVSANACEAETKKGMDSAQITGAASSYARKYALSGLFLIDDGHDADSTDNREPAKKEPAKKDLPWWNGYDMRTNKYTDDVLERLTRAKEKGMTAEEVLDALSETHRVSASAKAALIHFFK